MRIRQKKTSKKPFLIAAAVVVVLVASAFTYVYAFNGNILGWNSHKTSLDKMPTTNLSPPTDEQIKAGNDIKNGNLDQSDTSSTPPSQPGSSKEDVEVTITTVNQINGILQIHTQISRVVNTGQCTLTLTQSSKTVTKTADVQALASTSTCKGFDIPVSELSSGSWNATLTYENDTLLGTVSKVITVQ